MCNSIIRIIAVTLAGFGTASIQAAAVTPGNQGLVVGHPPQAIDVGAALAGGRTPGAPVRSWGFWEFRGDALEEVSLDGDTQIGGDVFERYDYGPASFDMGFMGEDGVVVPPDGIATGEVAGFNEGKTYWVAAEAPIGNAQIENDPIGNRSDLTQSQTFTKDSDDATFTFTITHAFIEAWDENGILGRPCPDEHRIFTLACDLIKGDVHLDVLVYTSDPGQSSAIFYRATGGMLVQGSGGAWLMHTWNEAEARVPLWIVGNYEQDFEETYSDFAGPKSFARRGLRDAMPYNVDLSEVETGHQFTVQVVTHAATYNRAAVVVSRVGSEGRSAVNAFLRDPATLGGTNVTTTGLTAIDTILPLQVPPDAPVTPAPCVPEPPPDPAAGVLQFSQASFTIAEADATPIVAITRTGGSTGAVTATITSTDGSAVAGIDYTPVHSSVFFADGDAETRVVEVPITQDAVGGEPYQTVNLTLSEPGGCAGLGAQVATVLTIRDDDPAPPAPSALDPSFAGDGMASLEAFGGDPSAMALQPDGKIVMVGGVVSASSLDGFILARFNPDGSVDDNFGDHGKVVTDLVEGQFNFDKAFGVAIQADNKIVVVGEADTDSGYHFGVVRYHSDGSLDDSFGDGGKIVDLVSGRAYSVAIQPDRGIVVGGAISSAAGTDIQLARFTTDGTLDASFGNGGVIASPTDIIEYDSADNMLLLPSGEIVVSGGRSFSAGPDFTGLARYLPNGSLDTAFGDGGKVPLSQRVFGGLARQSDGKLVLVGHVYPEPLPSTLTHFAVMRLAANGDVDQDFGDQGLVSTALSERGDYANAVVVQGDGRIVVAGASSWQTNANFGVARYLGDGTPDEDFSDDGVLNIDFFGFTDVAEGVAIQPNSRIVLGGAAEHDFDGYGVARVLPGMHDRIFSDGFDL